MYEAVGKIMIDLDELLTGNPGWEKVVEFWQAGEFYEQHYLIEAIERWLITEEQRDVMFLVNLTIEKMLNGRYSQDVVSVVVGIFNEWNKKLGFNSFGDVK